MDRTVGIASPACWPTSGAEPPLDTSILVGQNGPRRECARGDEEGTELEAAGGLSRR
jgi:hypothetical protein